MRRQARRRAYLTWGFFFGLLGVLTAVSAWKFGWVPIDVVEPDPPTPADSTTDNSKQDAPPFDFAEPPTDNIASADPSVTAAQSDPFLEAERRAGDPNVGRTSLATPSSRQGDDPGVSSMPRRLPAAAGAARMGRSAVWHAQSPAMGVAGQPGNHALRKTQGAPPNPRTGAGIVQVSNEVQEPNTSTPPQLREIDRLLAAGDTMTAHRELSKLYWNQPASRGAIQSRIEKTARAIYFAPQPHYLQPYVVQPGDQLRLIARKYRVPWEYLARLNGTDPRNIRPGQRLKVNNGPFSAVIDLSDFEITIHLQGYFVHSYPIGIGKDNATPIGKFTVTDKMVNPQYTDPNGEVFAADDPANPIGERWLALGNGYGIHGTIEPASVGRAESRGCIRMHNADVAEIYDLLVVGSEVVIQR